jgi:decaprenylphospho-beta-D-erythro-pentofuranosid-2-ulose 2-reductase
MRQRALEAGIGVRIETLDFDARDTQSHVLTVEEAFTLAGEAQAVVLAFGVLGDTASYEANPALAGGAAITNFAGGVTASLASVRALARQERPGTLIVLSSASMLRPRPANYIYGATKAGLDFFARGLADSAGRRGVRVMVVRPGFVHTKMTRELRSRFLATTPERVALDVLHGLERDGASAGRRACFAG